MIKIMAWQIAPITCLKHPQIGNLFLYLSKVSEGIYGKGVILTDEGIIYRPYGHVWSALMDVFVMRVGG